MGEARRLGRGLNGLQKDWQHGRLSLVGVGEDCLSKPLKCKFKNMAAACKRSRKHKHDKNKAKKPKNSCQSDAADDQEWPVASIGMAAAAEQEQMLPRFVPDQGQPFAFSGLVSHGFIEDVDVAKEEHLLEDKKTEEARGVSSVDAEDAPFVDFDAYLDHPHDLDANFEDTPFVDFDTPFVDFDTDFEDTPFDEVVDFVEFVGHLDDAPRTPPLGCIGAGSEQDLFSEP